MNPVDRMNQVGQGGNSVFAGGEGLSETEKQRQFENLASLGTKEKQPAPEVVQQQTTSAPAQPATQPEPAKEERMAVPSFDLAGLERSLAGSVGKEATKIVMDQFAKPVAEALGSVAREAETARAERLVQKFGAVYPEIKNPQAFALIARGGGTDAEIEGRIKQVYGDRKAEMRAQTAQQMTAPSRTVANPQPHTVDAINEAAWNHYQRTGDMQGAQRIKEQLMANR